MWPSRFCIDFVWDHFAIIMFYLFTKTLLTIWAFSVPEYNLRNIKPFPLFCESLENDIDIVRQQRGNAVEKLSIRPLRSITTAAAS